MRRVPDIRTLGTIWVITQEKVFSHHNPRQAVIFGPEWSHPNGVCNLVQDGLQWEQICFINCMERGTGRDLPEDETSGPGAGADPDHSLGSDGKGALINLERFIHFIKESQFTIMKNAADITELPHSSEAV